MTLAQQTAAEREAAANPANVKVGQVWQSNDPRASRSGAAPNGAVPGGVVQVEGAYAFCIGKLGQSVRIRLDRFGLKGTKGYTLIQDV